MWGEIGYWGIAGDDGLFGGRVELVTLLFVCFASVSVQTWAIFRMSENEVLVFTLARRREYFNRLKSPPTSPKHCPHQPTG